jgi:hypothetical protein
VKMVLVFDTEDWTGSRNSLKLAMQFFKAHHASHSMGDGHLTFTKIPMIKAVRQIAKAVENGKLTSGLRECKKYTEDHWIDWF